MQTIFADLKGRKCVRITYVDDLPHLDNRGIVVLRRRMFVRLQFVLLLSR